MLQYAAVRCSVLQGVAVCSSMVQCGAGCRHFFVCEHSTPGKKKEKTIDEETLGAFLHYSFFFF